MYYSFKLSFTYMQIRSPLFCTVMQEVNITNAITA